MQPASSDHSQYVWKTTGWLWLSAFTFGLFTLLIIALLKIPLPWVIDISWIPSLNIHLNFRIDAFSALLLLLITGIGSMVYLYAAGYFKHTENHQRLLVVLPIFMFAMMGAVSSDNLILLFIFWELTSVTSFLMVGFNHQDAKARFYARQAMFVSMGGGMAMLGGFIIMANLANSWSLSVIIESAPAFINEPILTLAIILILLGAFTKSAQFPFHFWLPNAMSAPTPVSAYLHSATMVKLGIYLMARFDAAFNYVLLWEVLLVSTGAITAIWAAILALRERDLKRILARTTLSALGILTLLIGLSSANAGLAVVAFLFAHAVYKAPLFMIAGNLDHATGTRIIDNLMGLRKRMPITAATAVIAGLSMAGLPLAFGFVAKDIVSDAKQQADLITLASYTLVLVNATAIAVAAVAAIRIFWGPIQSAMSKVTEVPWTMFLPPLALAIFGIEFDALPNYRDPLLLSSAQSISPNFGAIEIPRDYSNDMLIATAITLTIGVLLFLSWDRLHNYLNDIRWLDQYGPEASYEKALKVLQILAAKHTQWLQNGNLSFYISLTIVTLMSAGAAIIIGVLWHQPFYLDLQLTLPEQPVFWAVAGSLMLLSALATVVLRHNLAAIMASGLIGYGAAILFLFAGAPDLAFTQFMMETILVVVVASALPFFDYKQQVQEFYTKAIRITLAMAAGLGSFILLALLPSAPFDTSLAEWFSANSLPLAKGHNAVNVIIVDFRALDTFGEIIVVVFSLLAAIPLLKSLANNPIHHSKSSTSNYVLQKTAIPIYWLLFIASLVVVLRGHNDPGGGFIGGLIAVAASSWLAIQINPQFAVRYMWLSPLKVALSGVALALLAGLLGLLLSGEFLQHYWLGSLSTVILFDIGVFLAVWGGFSGYVFGLLAARHPHSQYSLKAAHNNPLPSGASL